MWWPSSPNLLLGLLVTSYIVFFTLHHFIYYYPRESALLVPCVCIPLRALVFKKKSEFSFLGIGFFL